MVGEGHEHETIFEPARQVTPSRDSAAVERAIRDLVSEELLAIDGGKVVSGSAWVSDLVNP